ncbi:ABC transporter ATP-binding protein [Ruania rhizosphaerae]|uniref:ABC transporter ATP-binding protein n=1 Tax=Ruania rhizosphaerae TaxID=1840413 RepID=UPI00135AF7F3|nr:ATP-binding cassette domain-containing protein [Ruania rhizosphaerae]
MPAALEVRDLTRRFGEKVAVDGVSFTVEPGTMTGFVGANGAGKTSTMRMIMGVLARHAGDVLWDERPITRADRAAFGYMPEERGLYPKQQILDQLCYLGQLRGMSRGDAARQAQRLLDRFELADRGKDKLEALSLGNQQRVQVAAALLHGPTALILDEPFSGLDPVAVDSMVDLLNDKLREGVPVLFSSHQLDLVDRLCDSLVVLSDGVVMASGSASDLRGRGPRRYRITTTPDAGWLREEPGLTVLDVDGATAIVEPRGDLTADLVTRAAARGLMELTPLVPTLADIYREVTR